MDIARTIGRLRANGRILEALVNDVDSAESRWRPADGQWSVLEVVNHLADEEVRDFRTRVDYTLHRPSEAWPPIDPVGWVTEERYNDRDLTASTRHFIVERAVSVEYLQGLRAAAWANAHEHPTLGPMTAADVLAAWVMHDHIHIRQINRVRAEYVRTVLAAERRTDYAGRW
jgi:hypothetical protein